MTMKTFQGLSWLLLAFFSCGGLLNQVNAQSSTSVAKAVVAAEMPKGHFLENITKDENGNLYITDYTGREVLKYNPKDGLSSLIELDAYPAGIITTPDGLIVIGQKKSILSSPEGPKTNHIFEISFQGEIMEDYAAPDAMFLNGITAINSEEYLATDALAGKIWHLNRSENKLTTWLTDDKLTAIAGKNVPGANGIKILDGKVFISNSARALLMTTDLADPAKLEVFMDDVIIDDFVFSSSSIIYATQHGPTILAIGLDKKVREFANGDDFIAGATAAAILKEQGREYLYVVGDGGFFEGKDLLPARLVKIPLDK